MALRWRNKRCSAGKLRSYLPITRFSIDQSDAVTSVSETLKHQTEEMFHTRIPIRVIHNFVNCDIYQPDEAKSLARQWAPA